MHNKLAGTKGFGRTIKIHPTPPQTPHRIFHTFSLTTYRHTQKADKNNSNMDSLINTTSFHKLTESAN